MATAGHYWDPASSPSGKCVSKYDRALRSFARAAEIGRPHNDRLFIDTPVYDYKVLVDLACAYHRVGDLGRAIEVGNRLLRRNELPGDVVLRVLRNRRYSLDARFPLPPAARCEQEIHVVVIQNRAGGELDILMRPARLANICRGTAVNVDRVGLGKATAPLRP